MLYTGELGLGITLTMDFVDELYRGFNWRVVEFGILYPFAFMIPAGVFGCRGRPRLEMWLCTAAVLPRLGKTTFLKVDKTLGQATAWLAVGVSEKTWGSIPLPIRFGSDLLVSPDLLLNTGTVTGTAGPGEGTGVQALKIPNDSRVLGTFTYLQWAIVDPVAKGIGLAFSDAIVLSPGR
jgi:hypothetical protein